MRDQNSNIWYSDEIQFCATKLGETLKNITMLDYNNIIKHITSLTANPLVFLAFMVFDFHFLGFAMFELTTYKPMRQNKGEWSYTH